jgi:hypothetical protein
MFLGSPGLRGIAVVGKIAVRAIALFLASAGLPSIGMIIGMICKIAVQAIALGVVHVYWVGLCHHLGRRFGFHPALLSVAVELSFTVALLSLLRYLGPLLASL